MNKLLSFLFVCLMHVSLAVASTYNLSVEVTPNGSGSLSTGGGTYEEGSTVYLRTYGNTGYVFKGWYDGETLLSSSSSFNYTMPAKDVLVKAKYEYDPTVPGNPSMPDTTTYYSFNAIVSPHGAGSLNSINARYAAGATVSLRTYNNTGYKFVCWQDENGVNLSLSTSYSYTMPNHDVTLTALYAYDPSVPADPDSMATRYTVTVVSKPMGGGSFNTSTATVEEGGNVRLYAYTNTGYQFLHWENEQGEVISSEQNFYYVMPHGNTKVFGVFDFNPAPPSNPNKNYWNKELGEVIVDDFTPGFLGSAVSNAISGSNRSDVAMITVAGKMNDNDFGIANDYTNCTLLDLSRVSGITNVPSYAFDYTNLESVYLPATIETIGYRAFADCKQLIALTVYAMLPPTLESNVFQGVQEGLVVYVPAASIAQYQDADGWKNFTILPIQEDIRSLSISLPEGTNVADYSQMWLELTNTKSGQKMHYVMTDRSSYTFANIIRNTTWNAVLRNQRGDVFGKIDNIEVKDEDVNVIFSSLAKPQNVSLTVKTPKGETVTSYTQITWLDADGNYLAQSTGLSGLLPGNTVAYKVTLSQDLSMQYVTPQQESYVVSDDDNKLTLTLEPIEQVTISGCIKDLASKNALSGATVTASQTFGGKYNKTISVTADAKGNYSLTVSNVPTALAVSASNYISQTIVCDSLMGDSKNISIPDILLKGISGAVITLDLTYTGCPTGEDSEESIKGLYADYGNVSYSIYNKTKQKTVEQFNVQYPQIVLLEEVEEGDVLEMVASSKNNTFMPVRSIATIDAEQCAKATFNIVELGKIKASFTKNANASVVGSLYDASGKLVKTYDFSNAKLTVNDLIDGSYTLVTMGASKLFNTIYDLSQLPQTGLVKDADYTQTTVNVKSGQVCTISIEEVPTLDESKLYYTGDNTSFTVNKPSIVAGNYLTLTGHLDFKSAYVGSVNNVQLIVDLPESCEFVENSVMVGNTTSSYTLQNNRVIIPMARYTDRVRFCIIPTQGGEYAPSALAQFDINGETITQPIGSANYTAKDLSINVPLKIARTTFTISGTAQGASDVFIYDGNVLIGQTRSLINGLWNAQCELHNPYNLSTHQIYAKVVTKNGLNLASETKACVYDKNALEVSTVTMINTAHTAANLDLHDYVTVFDFQNPPVAMAPYWYWPSYPDFTFLVDFTRNDPEKIKNVVIQVFTSDGKIVPLEAKFDNSKEIWVVKAPFYSSSLPVNLNVTFDAYTEPEFDNRITKDFADRIKDELEKAKDEGTRIITIVRTITDERKKENPDNDKISRLEDELKNFTNITPEKDKNNKEIADEITRKWYDVCPDDSGDNSDEEVSRTFEDFIAKEIEKQMPQVDPSHENIVDFINDIAEERPIIEKGEYHIPGNENMPEIKYVRNDGQVVTDPADMFRVDDRWEFSEQDSKGTDIVLKNPITGDQLYISSAPYSLPDENASKAEVNSFYKTLDDIVNSWGWGAERDLALGATGNVLDLLSKGWENNLNVANNLMKNFQNPDRIARLGQIADKYAGMIKAAKVANNIFAGIGAFAGGWTIGTDIVKTNDNDENWKMIMDAVSTHCDADAAQAINEVAKEYKGMYDRRAWAKTAGDVTLTGVGIASAGASGLSFGASLLITGASYLGSKGLDYWASCFTADDTRRKGNIRDLINSNKNCRPIEEWDPYNPLFPPLSPVMDPSGFVYECVTSNRVEGVTATAYYKEMVEDIYGDLHENIVKWDAEEYAQENPLFTDEYGMYAWDVPNGLWQVKFEKDGYETTYSEWLPVPPPQLDVNIAMKQNVQPNVKNARAYEDAVEVEFDKYMMPELLNTDNIIVMAGNQQIEGTIELQNEEVKYEGESETFASKVRFNATTPFEGTEVTLMVNNRVKSYAGIRMQDNYSQSFIIEQEIRKIVCDSATVVRYGDTGIIPVNVLPASASAGKTINVRISSQMILSMDVTSVVLDENGKADIPVSGELPGTAALTFTIDGYDLSATTIVNVQQIDYTEIAAPTANIASGTTIEKGTKITLSCITEGATIYYTLDGSCPCDEATRLVYTEPIVINETVTIKAMAVAPDMTESDIVEFTYIVNEGDGIDEVTLDTELKIYPLPVRDKLNVTAGGKIIKSVTLTSMSGSTVVKARKPVTIVTLDVSSLTPGIYIINVATEEKTYSRKIMKVE